MKGNAKVITALNLLIKDEVTAIGQYTVHAGMAENWGYRKLHDEMIGRAREEMKHLDRLIGRVLFLEGKPVVELEPLEVGGTMPEALANDLSAEALAIRHYNEAVKVAAAEGDADTRRLLEENLADETRHADQIEGQIVQIRQAGVGPFLAQKIGG